MCIRDSLGIDYRVDGKPMVASTASGTSRGWRVTLDMSLIHI